MARKGLCLDSLLADMGFNTAKDRFSSTEMGGVWREKKKCVASVGNGIPGHLGLVKLGIVHDNDMTVSIDLREKLFLQKLSKHGLVVGGLFKLKATMPVLSTAMTRE